MVNNQYYFIDKPIREKIRADKKEKRDNLTLDEVLEKSLKVEENLFSLKLLKTEKLVASYVSTKKELKTDNINKRLLDNNHTLVLPTIDFSKKGHMEFYRFDSLDNLVLNKYNIKEPIPSTIYLVNPSLIEVVLMPLVAFDLKGNRLGLGGGYYDRMLKRVSPSAFLIGIAYDFQQEKEIKCEHWDIPLDMVVTDKDIYNFNPYKK